LDICIAALFCGSRVTPIHDIEQKNNNKKTLPVTKFSNKHMKAMFGVGQARTEILQARGATCRSPVNVRQEHSAALPWAGRAPAAIFCFLPCKGSFSYLLSRIDFLPGKIKTDLEQAL